MVFHILHVFNGKWSHATVEKCISDDYFSNQTGKLLLANSRKGKIKLYFVTLKSESCINKGGCHFHFPNDMQFKYQLILPNYIRVTHTISQWSVSSSHMLLLSYFNEVEVINNN